MRLLVACGGTGGHIFPALSFLQRLKSRQPELDVTIVVTRRKIESRIIPKEYRTICVDFLPITFSFNFKTAIAITKLFIGTIQSLWIILRWRPRIVVGFGGYATIALVFFGHALGSKTVIHEQNVVAGVANTLLARFADRIAVSFNASKEYFKAYSKKTVYTGNPRCLNLSRVQKEEALAYFGLSQNKFTILVTGGSQDKPRIS
jgi:UDP-N-acetylglucosamine--N-acetylmuramyl-(pentapeptide) pyrophosphoryl-undecaprenol N-acetylglucosamine transferase